MKLMVPIKLLADAREEGALKETIKETNAICNEISTFCFENRVWNRFKIHKQIYHRFKASFNVSAQIIVRSIAKVSDSYKSNKHTKAIFRDMGAITYDDCILSYKENFVSIWTVEGRLKIPFVCYDTKRFNLRKGQADLIFKKGKFYLHQICEVKEKELKERDEFIGTDFGLTNIATLSTGEIIGGKEIERYREKRQRVRSSCQRKGTKGSKKVLKRLSGRERTTSRIINHTIANKIVRIAKKQGKGVAVERLTGIRKSADNKGKKFRTRVGRWNFAMLRTFLEYKCRKEGIPFVVVEPAYTSQTCHICKKIGRRDGEVFECNEHGSMHADINGAKVIGLLGASVNCPEKSIMYCTFTLH